IQSVTCNCAGTGFSGARCENNINDCTASSCLNGGRCIDSVMGTICDCTGTGFGGATCATPSSRPAGAACAVGSQCQSGVCTGGFCCAGACSGICATCQQGTGTCVAPADDANC